MRSLFHAPAALSIAIYALIVAATPASAAAEEKANYFGRWTVSDDKPHYSAKGREYKTIDIGKCGRDFCGVSVSDSGQCGATLFRFLGKNAGEWRLDGHGKWGVTRMKLSIEFGAGDGVSSQSNQLYLGLGDKRYLMDSRSSSMPKFTATYRRNGDAKCLSK